VHYFATAKHLLNAGHLDVLTFPCIVNTSKFSERDRISKGAVISSLDELGTLIRALETLGSTGNLLKDITVSEYVEGKLHKQVVVNGKIVYGDTNSLLDVSQINTNLNAYTIGYIVENNMTRIVSLLPYIDISNASPSILDELAKELATLLSALSNERGSN
jgi:hypothetical protein